MLMPTPAICLADVGDLGGVVEFVFYLMLFAVVWLVLTALLVRLLRKSSFLKRFGLSALFLVSPLLFLIGWTALEQFLGTAGKRVENVALRPVVVEGVLFPTGSEVTYEQLGGGFWHRRPVGAKTGKTVKLGSLDLNELVQIEGNADQFFIVLARAQTIDGWSCRELAATTMKKTGAQLHFQSCELAAPKTIDTMVWPAWTEVTRQDDGGWTLSRPDDSYGPPAEAFGIQFKVMDATYSPALVLKQWSAQGFVEDTSLGDYSFSSDLWNNLRLTANGDIRIEGGAKNARTGESAECVLMQLQGRRTTLCKPD